MDVVVGLVIYKGRLLLRQRKDANPMWDRKWEFPGGKIEPGESSAEAVIREVKEETGLIIKVPIFLGFHENNWDLPGGLLRVRLHCFRCHADSDLVTAEERSCYGHSWQKPAEILGWDHLDGNLEIIKKFLLDDQSCGDEENLLI